MTMPAELTRSVDQPDTVDLTGELGFASVPALSGALAPHLDGRGRLTVGLGGVRRADSAGLALLVEWLAQARAAGCQIDYQDPPEQLIAIARVSAVDTMLGFASSPGDA
jgi:phospholipid transport system transporter-binding protein